MRRLIIICLGAMVLMGCASIRYENDDEIITYTRFGGMNVNGIEAKRDENGLIKFSVGKSQGDMGQLADVLNRVMDAASAAAKTQTP